MPVLVLSSRHAVRDKGATTCHAEQDNAWMYELEPGRYCAYSCMSRRCDSQLQFGGRIHVIDTAKEARMGYGRTWEFDKIPAGHVVIRNDLASALGGVKAGDTIFVRMTVAPLLRFAFTPGGEVPASSGTIPTPTEEQPRSPSYAWGERTNFHAQVALSLRVYGVAQGTQGKMRSKTDNGMFMEYVAIGADTHTHTRARARVWRQTHPSRGARCQVRFLHSLGRRPPAPTDSAHGRRPDQR